MFPLRSNLLASFLKYNWITSFDLKITSRPKILNQATHKLNQGDFSKDLREFQLQLIVLLSKILKAFVDGSQHDQG